MITSPVWPNVSRSSETTTGAVDRAVPLAGAAPPRLRARGPVVTGAAIDRDAWPTRAFLALAHVLAT